MSNITVCGNVGREPELRFTQGGKAVTNFPLAIYTGKDQAPQWLDVTVWEEQAEEVCESVSKGDRVIVAGRFIEPATWEKDGVTLTRPRMVADDVGLSMRWVRTRPVTAPDRSDEEPFA